jgi:hypothetical protein
MAKKYIFLTSIMVLLVLLSGCTEDSHQPTASFLIEPIQPQKNEIVYLNSTSSDTQYDIESYEWYINDEFISDQNNIIYIFEQNGSYDISLTVTNEQESSDSFTETIIIGLHVDTKQKLLGLWKWEGNNQVGNWTFYENNTLKSVFSGVLPTGEFGSSSVVYWNYEVDGNQLYFSNPSNEHLDEAVYSFEFLNNDTLLRITDLETGSTAEWDKSS